MSIHITYVDYSDKMVTSAQDQEEKNPVGAKYAQSSVEAYKHEMPVDFVLCHKVLHFAKTHEQLQAMCRSIGDNLKAGGRFAGTVVACFRSFFLSVFSSHSLLTMSHGAETRQAYVKLSRSNSVATCTEIES